MSRINCKFCKQQMNDGVGCNVTHYNDFADKIKRERLPHDEPGICHDCGVSTGQLHHPGCDTERCPKCQGRAISCGCTSSED